MFFGISVFESFVPVRAVWWWGKGRFIDTFFAVQTHKFPVIGSQA